MVRRSLVPALCILAFCSGIAALAGESSENPYREIFARNVFGLRPPPIARVEAPPPVLPKITLTGITTILRSKRALLKVQLPAQPLKPLHQDSYILAEGQTGGPIKVLQINEKESHVKLMVSGTVISVTFDQEKPSPTPAPPPSLRLSQPWPRLPFAFKAAAR